MIMDTCRIDGITRLPKGGTNEITILGLRRALSAALAHGTWEYASGRIAEKLLPAFLLYPHSWASPSKRSNGQLIRTGILGIYLRAAAAVKHIGLPPAMTSHLTSHRPARRFKVNWGQYAPSLHSFASIWYSGQKKPGGQGDASSFSSLKYIPARHASFAWKLIL